MDLLQVLEDVFVDDKGVEREEPDTSRLKYLLMAIIEEGQRHDGVQGHGHDPPTLGVHPCARKGPKGEIYCRYLMPRELRDFVNADCRGKNSRGSTPSGFTEPLLAAQRRLDQ